MARFHTQQLPDRGWEVHAACRGQNTSRWFPPPGVNLDPEAEACCAGCPVRSACLLWAVDAGELHGWWGGRSPQARMNLSERDLTAVKVAARLELEAFHDSQSQGVA